MVTISSWILTVSRPREGGLRRGKNFLVPPYDSQRVVFASLWALFYLLLCANCACTSVIMHLITTKWINQSIAFLWCYGTPPRWTCRRRRSLWRESVSGWLKSYRNDSFASVQSARVVKWTTENIRLFWWRMSKRLVSPASVSLHRITGPLSKSSLATANPIPYCNPWYTPRIKGNLPSAALPREYGVVKLKLVLRLLWLRLPYTLGEQSDLWS